MNSDVALVGSAALLGVAVVHRLVFAPRAARRVRADHTDGTQPGATLRDAFRSAGFLDDYTPRREDTHA